SVSFATRAATRASSCPMSERSITIATASRASCCVRTRSIRPSSRTSCASTTADSQVEETMLKRCVTLVAFAALCLHAVAAPAADAKAPASAAELAAYQGPDRMERLIAGAKREGELNVYHVYPNLPVIINAFTSKYGIK